VLGFAHFLSQIERCTETRGLSPPRRDFEGRRFSPWSGVVGVGLALVLFPSAALFAEPSRAFELASGTEWLARDTPLEIVVARWPTPEEARLAVVVAGSDRTDLFRRSARGLIYRSELLPLPAGESEIVVYAVSPAGLWRELSHLPLRVRHRGGYEQARLTARGTLAGLDPLDRAADGPAQLRGVPQRGWSLQLASAAEATRGSWRFKPTLQLLGASEEVLRLRFRTKGADAPQIDLASYSFELSHAQGARFVLGNLSLGVQRLLTQNFQARGLKVELPLSSRLDASFAATSGSLLVGWDRPLGIDPARDRILTGTLGLELLPRRGGLRLEGTWLSGKVEPQDSFNRGFVTGAEESLGWGLRLAAATPHQRLRFEGGYSRVRFDNGSDGELESGLSFVKTAPETRAARYAELALDLLQKPLASGFASATLVLRHQRVDPLYRVVGLVLQSDREENAAELRLGLGGLRGSVIASGFADNLDHIPTLVATRNRRQAILFALPLAQLFASPPPAGRPPAPPSPWLPVVSYAFDRNHQYGLGIPPGTDLRPDQIPDQVSTLQNLGLDWQAVRWRAGYRFSLSQQDNRQPGRERADFRTGRHTLTASARLAAAFDCGFDLSHESAFRREQDVTDTNDRLGANLSWRMSRALTLLATAGETRGRDDRQTHRNSARDADLQLAWALAPWKLGQHGAGGQLFLRYGREVVDAIDQLFTLSTHSRRWVVASGLSLTLF